VNVKFVWKFTLAIYGLTSFHHLSIVKPTYSVVQMTCSWLSWHYNGLYVVNWQVFTCLFLVITLWSSS